MFIKSGFVFYWDIESEKVIFKEEQKSVFQIIFYEKESRSLVVSRMMPELKAICISRNFPSGDKLFDFEFPYRQFRNVILSSANHYFVALGHEKGKDMLFIHHANTGSPLHKFPVKYPHFKDVQMIVPVPDKDSEIALIDQDKGNIVHNQCQEVAELWRICWRSCVPTCCWLYSECYCSHRSSDCCSRQFWLCHIWIQC